MSSIQKNNLEAELTRVKEELSSIAQYDEATGDWTAIPDAVGLAEADENSEADGLEEWNERTATVTQLEMIHQNIVRALQKIEAGTYGTCEICGTVIEEDRLEVLPTARTCKEHRDEERTLSF
ncbi:MAG: hypothetical protein RL538_155 [Candidatus Parcubacteria bacterium]|jgi:RNA polymerase-binding transcription factor DksA